MCKRNEKMSPKVVFPFFKGIMFPIEELIHNFGVFLRLAGIVSLCYSTITLAMGQNYLCLIAAEQKGLFCVNNVYLSLFSLLLWGMVLAYFVNRWYLVTKCGECIKNALRMRCWKKDLKTFCFMLGYLGLWLLIGVAIYLLKKRIATPNWLFELFLFTVGAGIVITAVFLLLNSVLFVRFLQGKDWLVLRQTALPVFDNIYKIVAYFLFYLLFFVYLLQLVKVSFLVNNVFPLWLIGLLGSFFEYMVVCALAVCFVALLDFQEKQIFSDGATNQR